MRSSPRSVLGDSIVGSLPGAATADTRTVLAIVALLAVIGIGLAMLAVWLFRITRPDKELLAPLEVMGDRKWRRGEPVWQRRRLDEVRPAGAVPARLAVAPPAIDEAYEAGPSAPGFEDLSEGTDLDDVAATADSGVNGDDAQASSNDVDAATETPADTDTDADDSERTDTDTDTDTDGTDSDDVDNAGIDDSDDVADTDNTTFDGVPSESVVAVLVAVSDDVSSTPKQGVSRTDFSAAGPSADPDASLADLVAAAEEPPRTGNGADELAREAD